MSVPAVQGERADARTLGARQEFRRRICCIGEIFAHLLDPADLDRWAIRVGLDVYAAGAGDRGKPNPLLERPRQRRTAKAC